MSRRLHMLRLGLARRGLRTDDDRLDWLNRMSFETDGLIGYEEWAETLVSAARQLAAARGTGVVDAWFAASELLAGALPDPDDKLYGIALAVHARTAGLRYEDPRAFADLFQRYAGLRESLGQIESDDPGEEAYQTYEFISNRLMELELALGHTLENGDAFVSEMLADPAVVVAGAKLLWAVVEDRNEQADEDEVELGEDVITQCVEYGGHYLWAAYHARRNGIDDKELTSFVISFDEWFGIMDSLERRKSLAPGVLASLRDCEGNGDQLVEDGPDLVDTWRLHHAEDLPLSEYLTQVLTAVVQDA